MAWNEPGGKGNPNDPWGNNNRGNNNRGGGGGGNQPPDLDEALKQLLDKLNGMFGGKGNGGNSGNSSNGNGGGLASMAVIAAAIIVVLVVFNSFYTLDETERGVVLRMGKYHDTTGPGFNVKAPLIDSVLPVNTTGVREVEVKERMLTEDENIVEIELSVQYRVSDPVKYALRVESPERTLVSAAESSLRHEVGSTKMDQILTVGRNLLADQVQVRLQNYLDRYETGMVLSTVNIKDARAPSQVKDAFDDVQKAKQDKDRFISEAEAYANSVVPEARGKAQRELEEASAYKDRVIARAEGEAARFNDLYAEYKKAPAVMRERLYIDALSSVYTQSSKVLVDVDGGNNMMYLPLDQIIKNMPVSPVGSSGSLSNDDISRLTDQVLEEVRSRQTTSSSTRREGR
ncbi:FtsH protease activity modulator HflK [Oceanobacter mangrovi]|uniref:FtsH protease activity modulator HflK n=1 Tax=Oceanobacter mangrovi TaxID=2862510 RepID=UPI001C8E8494|nr:FtsH protease activity modulator HflK [Oceanobacter mangrovi]